jgi:hypothetical protein
MADVERFGREFALSSTPPAFLSDPPGAYRDRYPVSSPPPRNPANKRKAVPANMLTPTSPGTEALSVAEGAATGDQLATFRALRQRLAVEFDRCRNKRVMASLAAQLSDVVRRIEALERSQRGQQLRTAASNEDAEHIRSLVAAAVRLQAGVPDALL